MKLLTSRILLLLLIVTAIPFNTAYAGRSPALTADAAILVDGRSGMVLYEKNPDKIMYPASTTKIMTAIIALEKCGLNEQMVASVRAVHDIGPDGMHIGVLPGEVLTFNDLLHALLIKSANDTANIMAENIAGSIENFVEMMNIRAKELGAKDTNFMNPHGNHHPAHYTTVSDMAKIARHAMSIPKFREIVSTRFYEIPPSNLRKKPIQIYTTNKMFLKSSAGKNVYYPSAIGIKTGYTDEAGHNFIGAASKDNAELISVIMGCRESGVDNGVFAETINLFEYGFSNYSMQEIAPAGQSVLKTNINKAGFLQQLDAVTPSRVEALMPNDKSKWSLTVKPLINSGLSAPVRKGDVVGSVEYRQNGFVAARVDLIALNGVRRGILPFISDSLVHLWKMTIVRIIFISIFSLSVFIFLLRPFIRCISHSVKKNRNSRF